MYLSINYLERKKKRNSPLKLAPSNTVPFQSSVDTDDTGYMIQDFILNIKSAFDSQNIKFYNEPDFQQIQDIEAYCLNHLELSSLHTHNDIVCKSSNIKYYQCYQRHYVSFHNGRVNDQLLEVPVMYCYNDGHFHSILPAPFIIPHSSYSVCFILLVLSLKMSSSLTVEKIVNMFHISVSTLYQWVKKYSYYLRIFSFLKNRYHMHFFIHLIYDYENVISDIFDMSLHTLFQSDRKLFQSST